MKCGFKIFVVMLSVLACTAAKAQNSGTVTQHAFAVGKGPGVTGFTSLLCAAAQLAVGQSGADPVCRTVNGDATFSAGGAFTLNTVNANVGTFGSSTQCVSVTVNAKGQVTAASQTACATTGITQLTGDVTAGPGTGSQVATLATVNANTGTFGGANSIPQFTVNGKGLITGVVATVPAIPFTEITGNATVAQGGTNCVVASGTCLDNITGFSSTGYLNRTGAGTYTFTASPSPGGSAGGDLTGTYPNPTLAGIITAGGPTGSATVAPIITYDAKGRVTAVSSATITPAIGSVTGLGTGVGAALAVNVGTAGAPVVNGGALGTPSSGTATNLTGTAAGLTAGSATTATTATNATNSGITNDTSTNATMFPVWVTANTGNLPLKVTSTKLSFNPSTGALSSTSFAGAGTGLTGTAAGLTANNVTTLLEGTTVLSGGTTGRVLFNNGSVLGEYTTVPTGFGGTGNTTGTATINANLTGCVTSVGNATSITAGCINTNTPVFMGNAFAFVAPGTTVFYGVNSSATEATVSQPAGQAMTIKNCYASVTAAAGAGNSWTYTVRQNGSNTAVTWTVSGASQVLGSDLTHTVALAATDLWDVQVVASLTATNSVSQKITCTAVTASP